jgi:hypothetical protein
MNIEHVLADEDAVFAAAVTAVVTADADALRSQLKSHPELATSRARAAHRSTLLHYTAANGIETELQSTPASIYQRLATCTPDEQLDLQTNALEVVSALLDAGADVTACSEAYGGDADVMGLLVSSAHPAIAGVQSELIVLLLNTGFPVDGLVDDGNPLAMALGSGHVAAAQALAAQGARVDNLIFAAGLGRLEDVKICFDSDGKLLPNATFVSKRDQAYTHTGYLRLTHSQDPGEVRQQAFNVACLYDHLDVVQFMLDKGVDLKLRDPQFDRTPSGWANAFTQGRVAKLLRQ